MKVHAGMAVLPERAERAEVALRSIARQVDEVHAVWQSESLAIPSFLLRLSRVRWSRADNSRGDAEKFLCRPDDLGDAVWLGCDDDLEYPPGYTALIRDWLANANSLHGGAVVSFHGRVATRVPMRSYYADSACPVTCLGFSPKAALVDFVGTGCCAFYSPDLLLSEGDFKTPFAADVHLSAAAREQGLVLMGLPSPQGWFGYDHNAVPVAQTIWGKHHDDDELITQHANKVLIKHDRQF